MSIFDHAVAYGGADSQVPEIAVVRRQVVKAAEYTDVAIPIDLVIHEGKLDIYPELTRSNVLRTYSKDGQLILQAGGLIGFIPLNDRLALEIEPRVPIGNLERILLLAGNVASIVLAKHLSSYRRSNVELPQSFLDVLADRLVALGEACWNEGLHSEYVPRIAVGQSPRGRLHVYATAKRRVKTHDSLVTVSEQFHRTHDTGPNRCIAAALDRLHSVYSGMKDRAGARRMASRLRRARQLIGQVSTTQPKAFERHTFVIDPASLPASRPSYPAAVALSKVVLSGEGFEIRSREGNVTLPPMMIRMEVAFEAYLRVVLSANQDGFAVLDGNLRPPDGASTKLFHSAPDTSAHRRVPSTPDIVLQELAEPAQRVVMDAKYKLDISREDVNQVLGYALTYRTRTVVLATPRKSDTSPHGLQLLGEVSGVSVYLYVYDLGSRNLEAEEHLFRTAARDLLAAARPLA